MKDNNSKTMFELGLIQKNRISNIIFTLGTAVIFDTLNRQEQSIRNTKTNQSSDYKSTVSSYNFEKSYALANWIFLIAGIISFNAASESLKDKTANRPRNFSQSSENNIAGSKMVADGNLFRVIGYLMSAVGREIIAGSIINK